MKLPLRRTFRRFTRTYATGRRFLFKERKYPVDVPLANRVALWRRGFGSRAAVMYDFETHGHQAFLNDWQIISCRPRPTGGLQDILDNKLLFHLMMRQWPGSTPRLYGVLCEGKFFPDPVEGRDVGTDLLALCEAQGALVLKGFLGGSARRVRILEYRRGRFRVNGRRRDPEWVRRWLERRNRVIVTERIRQARYARQVWSKSLNTIRIVTLRDPETGRAFVASAVHRFGTRASGSVDNWSCGGIAAGVDLETGCLETAVTSPHGGGIRRVEEHPDTGARLPGIVIPGWEEMKQRVLTWTDELVLVHHCGWDVVVQKDGRVVAVEANTGPGLSIHQAFGPLLSDPRIEAFYRHHGALGDRDGNGSA